jgi:anaerobic magnesium-protoporphyrin IX monomethyl ester cyclase
MKIIFINPGWTETLGSFAAVGRKRMCFTPLGLEYLASSVLDSGYQAEIIDAEAERLGPEAVVRLIRQKAPDIVGINMFATTMHKTIELAKKIKETIPGLPVVVGGAHVSVCKEACMVDVFDYGIYKKAEISIV